jgi:hypothetical protein
MQQVSGISLPSVFAREPLNNYLIQENHPSGAKARLHFVLLTARLKSCPFKTATHSEVPQAVTAAFLPGTGGSDLRRESEIKRLYYLQIALANRTA